MYGEYCLDFCCPGFPGGPPVIPPTGTGGDGSPGGPIGACPGCSEGPVQIPNVVDMLVDGIVNVGCQCDNLNGLFSCSGLTPYILPGRPLPQGCRWTFSSPVSFTEVIVWQDDLVNFYVQAVLNTVINCGGPNPRPMGIGFLKVLDKTKFTGAPSCLNLNGPVPINPFSIINQDFCSYAAATCNLVFRRV